MQIIVNGQSRTAPDALSVAGLLEAMALEPRRVAVELNKRLVPRAAHAQTVLADRDALEIVTLVGGG